MASPGVMDRGSSEFSLPSYTFTADSHNSSSVSSPPSDLRTTTIPKSEYEALRRRSLEYERLKQALIQGGIPFESLETLINGPDSFPETTLPSHGASPNHYQSQDVDSTERVGTKPTSHGHPQQNWTERPPLSTINAVNRLDPYDNDDDSFRSEEKLDSPTFRDGYAPTRQTTPDFENRTIVLKGIPERATHRDAVANIRGGKLVDIFLRARERVVCISFADAKAAHEFLLYAKREYFYISGKLVDVSWSDRQFTLSPYLTTQLSNGASRNLVIRGVHPNLTENQIREDMEHIHNLIIISIHFRQGNAYISTNSLQKASYARNCMRSRMPYKLMRIEYDEDECAEPLPKIRQVPRKEAPRPAAKLNPMANRFQMLNMDESDDDSDSSDDSEELTSHASRTDDVRWTNTAIAV